MDVMYEQNDKSNLVQTEKPDNEDKVEILDDDDDDDVDMTYTKELRQATKEVHKISDVLVNAKFALALTDDKVWADGLLAFYEIYKYLERYLPNHLLPEELHRTEAFEKDLKFFYGKDWKVNYTPRESVSEYLKHLDEVRMRGDIYLFAYAFQMYMALMSGGQLLQKKRMIKRKLWKKTENLDEKQSPANPDADPDDLQSRPMPLQVDICPEGCAATYFPYKISVLKNKLRRILNQHYVNFTDEVRAQFIKESQNVFTYNIEVVRSIKGVNAATLRKTVIVALSIICVYLAYKLVKN